jgi:hypothetical protein
MYNRILKRPMFKRGGSSYQSQGTGITSPYDTPRKRYADGPTWEEINERRSNIFQPRSEMDFAAEGFSALGDPYKKSGDAKTIGEMLYEGAGQVRKSRAADKALGQSVDLANIESDASRLLADEKHARDLELVEAQAKSTLNKDYSIKRQVLDLTKQLNKQAENQAYEGAEFINDGFAQSIAQGTVEINENGYHAMVVPMSAIKRTEGVWRINKDILAPGMVYWNPINQQWLIVQNARTKNATPIHYGSYAEAKAGLKVTNTEEGSSTSGADSTSSDASDTEIKNNEIKMKIVTNLKDVDINDKSVIYDEAQKVGIKIVENTEGSKQFIKNLADNEMTLFTFTEILKKKKMSDTYGHISSKKGKRGDVFDQITEEIKVAEMATGGRAGYASGTEPDDDLNELTSWWKSEVDNSFNS